MLVGHLKNEPGTTIYFARINDALRSVEALIRRRREKNTRRFQGPVDGLRLVALGFALTLLATVEFVNIVFSDRLFGFTTGAASIFGGLLSCIVITRINPKSLYIDWILTGALYLWLGLILMRSYSQIPAIDPRLFSNLFCTLFIITAASRLWIGATSGKSAGDLWLIADGMTGIFFSIVAVLSVGVGYKIGLDLILVCDLLIHGISIILFGTSLNSASATRE